MASSVPLPKESPLSAQTRTIADQPSWVVSSDAVELAVTRLGGHMGPVTFFPGTGQPIQPYYVSPWQEEKLDIDEPVLRTLRGDFFCMPFGGNNRYRGEDHVAHGETATAEWTLADLSGQDGATTLTLTMDTTERPGRVTKELTLVDGQSVVYCTHTLEGFSGKMCLGHHATLALPEQPGALRVATSRFQLGMTNPKVFSDPAGGEYQSFRIGKRFTRLSRVPVLWPEPGFGDASSFPIREGFTDLLAICRKPTQRPAWTTATVASRGYLWFSLKDAAVLPTTAMWISNRGRHGPPWNGRNRCLGLEDVCAYFAEGLADSARTNLLSEAGYPTTISLSKRKPTRIRYIQGVVRVPDEFQQVRTARFQAGRVVFVSTTGMEVTAEVDWGFLGR